MSTFFFDDEESYYNNDDGATKTGKWAPKRKAQSYEVSNTLLSYQPTNAIDPVEEASYHKYMRESQYQAAPPPKVQDPVTGEDVIIASRDFQVSLIGEDGPDEYLSTVRAADRLTTVWEDAQDIRARLDSQYYTGGKAGTGGGGYSPIEFGIPKYTGDFGYPVVDPNPGNCKPGFLKDQFGRCLHVSWFNLPYAPAGNPWVDISGNSIIQNGMSPINGVCPNDMFLASNGKCYFFPSPPQSLPPPPVSGVPVGASGSSSYGSAFYGKVHPNQRNAQLFGKSPNGRVYNTPPRITEALYGSNTVEVQHEAGAISQVYVERKYLSPGDRVNLVTTVTLYDQTGGFHLGVVVPDLNFKVATPEIPVTYPGISEEIESNFTIPLGTEPGDYVGEVQLVQGARKIDSANFVISVD